MGNNHYEPELKEKVLFLYLEEGRTKKSVIEEFNTMISICETNTFIGANDKLMSMHLCNSGLRVSELFFIKRSDIKKLMLVNI